MYCWQDFERLKNFMLTIARNLCFLISSMWCDTILGSYSIRIFTNDLQHRMLFLQVLRTAVGHRLARVQGFLFKAAFLRRVPTFTRLIVENLILCFLQSTLYQTSKYLTGSLSLHFKKILTDIAHADYFEVLLLQFCFCIGSILCYFLVHTFLTCILSSEYHEEYS